MLVGIIVFCIAFSISMGITMIAMWIVSRFCNLTIPDLPEWALKVAGLSLVSALLDRVPTIGWLFSIFAFLYLLHRWFDVDVLASVYVVAIRFAIGLYLQWTIVALVLKALD